jgi:hypothetical protein
LLDAGKVSQNWWDTDRVRQMEATEAPYEKLIEHRKPTKVVSIKTAKAEAERDGGKIA